ncbi:PAS/PAC sensor signal transduction histidine kinase [Tenacibaculum adriaticum]|uniref:histidine kinase n=1 Tax=Tenacibaculum adriaticum TaxID=413713 RepID=A0A5S5DWB0_9FLAO|nr:PAS domain-containing sensor histidine kinase [Tenacibaculum adriaticum]TYQ00261.1 PAS/PAC sensor signal transduction histidine kinase [Tenacibaculum adriaticum]
MFQKDQDIFNLLFESVSEGVIVVDEQQKIVSTNTTLEHMFGYESKELVNQPLTTVIPKNYRPNHSSHFKGFLKAKSSRQMGHGRDLFGARKDGTTFPVEVGLNPFEIYGKTFVMALVIDISIRKQQELEIQQLNADLEKKVDQRTKALSESIKELKLVNEELDEENKKRIEAERKAKEALKQEKELNELKTKFLSLVSHEFKTPLSGILTSTILLSKYKLTEQQEKRDKHIKTITDKVHYLNNILNDFLSIEKLENGKIKYNKSTFKVSKVVNEVIYGANMLLKDGQKINYPENIDDISLHQDEKIVELALSNLVNNAVKYSSERTVIDIDIKQNGSFTIFGVKDNGIGIPEKDQKNIFKRYYRAENALLTQGTGIGLNIVKQHLENLGGNISFKSKENEGTIFTIKIPNKAEL